MKNNAQRFETWMFCVIFIMTLGKQAISQKNKQDMIRSKIWVTLAEAASPATSRNISLADGFAYPGYFNGDKNICTDFNEMSVMAFRDGKQVWLTGMDTQLDDSDPAVTFNLPATIIRNYNFVERNNLPADEQFVEEILKSDFTINDPDANTTLPRIRMTTRSMAWSLPEYDDFIITEFTITSIEPTEILYNLNFTLKMIVSPADAPTKALGNIPKSSRHDTEFVWDEKRQTFIFYDAGMYFEQFGGEVFQKISPGHETGDVGDPGNIYEANNIDFQLYSPQAMTWGYVDVPPNELDLEANPNTTEGSVDWQVASGSSMDRAIAPPSEQFEIAKWHGSYHNIPNPPTKAVRLLKFPQSRENWRVAYARDPSLTTDGNLVERVPTVISVIGPYHLAPGETISFKRIIVFGELDRTIAMRGGLTATRQLDMDFVTDKEGGDGSVKEHAAIKALRENWNKAVWLIRNNYKPEKFPPPTVGIPPGAGVEASLGQELIVEPLEESVGDITIGVKLIFDPVPAGYVDPLTGENDFAGYIIKQSDVGIEGPWIAIDTLDAESVNLVNGRIEAVVETPPALPLLFGVTTYDRDGNESGMTSYSRIAMSAKVLAPTDHDLAKVRVVPNPFKQTSFFANPQEAKLLKFMNIPGICTIRIYNLALDHIVTIEHDDGLGEEAWGSNVENNYMLTKFSTNVMPGMYFYHITSHVPGHEGEEATGKFVVIK